MTRTTVKESVAKDLCRLHAADPGAGGSNIGMCERANTISGGGIVRGYRGIISGILVHVQVPVEISSCSDLLSLRHDGQAMSQTWSTT